MDVQAKVKNIRMSPKKVRLVLDAVRNTSAEEALHRLALLNKRAARPVYKLIKSAIANAEHNHELKGSDLTIKKIVADEGPTLKRWRPRAFGRAGMIRKRTSHILVVLTDGKEEVVAKPIEKKEEKAEVAEEKTEKKETTEKETEKKTEKKEVKAETKKQEKKPAAKKTKDKAEEKKVASKTQKEKN